MKPSVSPALFWTPRILSLAFVAFLMLFSLDVFDMELDLWGLLLALFMHNIPALILLALTLVAWKREIVGGIAFIAAGFLYIVLMLWNGVAWYLAISWSMTLAGPAFLIGALYLVGWSKRKKTALSTTTTPAKP